MAIEEPISKRIPNKRHRAFVDEYFKCNMNGTKAYQAVYDSDYDTARANAAKLLADTSISEEVEDRLQQMTISANEVLARLSEQAKAEYSDYIKSNGTVDLAQIEADGKLHLVKKIKPTKYGDVVEFYDAQSALGFVGKKHGIFSDNLTVKVEGELEKLLDTLQSTLDTDTYNKVVEALASEDR